MKRLVGITIAYLLIIITQIKAQENAVDINRLGGNTIELRDNRGSAVKKFFLQDSLDRNWSTYHYVDGGAFSALVSKNASEVFFLKGDSAMVEGWPEPHYALQGSAYYMFDDQLYGYGGYGFWTSKNILRFWNTKKGWVPVLTSSDSPALIPAHNSVLSIQDSIVLIIGGETTDARNPFVRNDLKIIQKVNLSSRKVELIDIKNKLNQDNLLIRTDSVLVFEGFDKLIALSLHDLALNEILLTEDIVLSIENLNEEANNERMLLKRFKYSRDLDQVVDVDWVPVAIVVTLVLAFLIRSALTKSKNVTKGVFIEGNSLKCGSNVCVLVDEEIDILKYLKENGSAQSEEINMIFSSDLSISHLNRLRSSAIKNINNQVMSLTNNDVVEIIGSRKAKRDSRMREYFLNSDITIKN